MVKDPFCVLHPRPSTLVSLVDGGYVILRDGPISAEAITAALSEGAA